MNISWLKLENDNKSFKIPKNLGLNVVDVQTPENVDIQIKELIKNNCDAIIVSNEVASFSEDIIKKYSKDEKINIIIAPVKK